MADNVAITAGSGTAIATDEVQVSGSNPLAHVQFVKLVDGTLNGTATLGGDATNGLDVDVTRMAPLVAGSASIGSVKVHDGTNDISVETTAGDGVSNVANRLRASATLRFFNGSDWDRARGDITNGLDVDVTRLPAASPMGVTGANHQTGTNSATGTGDTIVIGAPGAGSFLYITSISVHNSGTMDTFVNIKDGTTTRLVLGAPAKGGHQWQSMVPLRLSDNAALQFASGAGVTTMYVSAVGYRATS